MLSCMSRFCAEVTLAGCAFMVDWRCPVIRAFCAGGKPFLLGDLHFLFRKFHLGGAGTCPATTFPNRSCCRSAPCFPGTAASGHPRFPRGGRISPVLYDLQRPVFLFLFGRILLQNLLCPRFSHFVLFLFGFAFQCSTVLRQYGNGHFPCHTRCVVRFVEFHGLHHPLQVSSLSAGYH